jgi:hypothetical protein
MITIEVGQLYVAQNGRYKGRKIRVVGKPRARHWTIETLETGRRNTTSSKSLSDTTQWALVPE